MAGGGAGCHRATTSRATEKEEDDMQFESYLRDIPKLHSWDGGVTWGTGGFDASQLRAIFSFIQGNAPQHPRIIETGAGNSTLCFLHLEPGKLRSIAPDQALFDRIDNYCERNDLKTDCLERHIDGSEWVLPVLAKKEDEQFDFALIDGSHNWPMVMVDFHYVNVMIGRGGFIMLDDVHLHSVKELARLLAYDPTNFRVRADLGKALIFEKMTGQRQLGEWNTQPYIREMSRTYLHHPTALRLWQVKPLIFLSKLLLWLSAVYWFPRRVKRALVKRTLGGLPRLGGSRGTSDR
jgi:methyltransferase family protein